MAGASLGDMTETYDRLRLTITRNGTIVDVVDAWPASFYGWLPAWLAQYQDCVIHARLLLQADNVR